MKQIAMRIVDVLFIFLAICAVTFIYTFIQNGFSYNKANVFGYKATVVVSESMKPALKVGTLAISKSVKYDEIQTGDIIIYEHCGENGLNVIVIHRVFEKFDTHIKTKGDNNQDVDVWDVNPEKIIGKVILHT